MITEEEVQTAYDGRVPEAAGPLMLETARKNECPLLPVDSEHNAIFQAMQSGGRHEVKRIILTGGTGAIGKAIRAHAEPRGLGIQGGRYGHGMGMDYAELPALAETTATPIEPGTPAAAPSATTGAAGTLPNSYG